MDDLYDRDEITTDDNEFTLIVGRITEKERLVAAKQILLGLSILYIITLLAYLYKPIECDELIDICETTFPPLATLILAFYFREKC